jgi:DNA-binding GntR family transcriptional regulator
LDWQNELRGKTSARRNGMRMPMSTKDGRQVDLRDQVYQQLRSTILSGGISADTRLTDGSVARELGVSRTPAREALLMLTQDGLVNLDSRGFHIPQLSAREVEETYQVRLLLEPPACRWICLNAPETDLITVCDYADREMDQHADDNADAFVPAIRQIRMRIYGLLESEVWRDTIFRFEGKARILRFQTMLRPEVRQLSLSENRQLIYWLRRREADGAEAAMTMLLASARQTTLAAARAQGRTHTEVTTDKG